MTFSYNWKGFKILIVEDDDTNYQYLSILLSKHNATIVRSDDGLDAFFVSMSSQPDLILMDIRLPRLNGVETMRLIKKYHPSIPIICISADVAEENIDNCYASGCDAFIAKPVIPDVILPIVNIYFEKETEKTYSVATVL